MEYEFPLADIDDAEQRSRLLLSGGWLGECDPRTGRPPLIAGHGPYSQLARSIIGDGEPEQDEVEPALCRWSDAYEYDPFVECDEIHDAEEAWLSDHAYPDNYCSFAPVDTEGCDQVGEDSAVLNRPLAHYDELTSLGCPTAEDGDNRAGLRSNACISPKQVANILHGVNYANQNGLIMNCALHLVFGLVGCQTDEDCRLAFRRFQDRFRNWSNSRGLAEVYWYCWERSNKHGLHTHVQMYIPPERQEEFRIWAKATARTLHCLHGSDTKQPFVKLRRDAKLLSQWAVTRYFLKGIRRNTKYSYYDESGAYHSENFASAVGIKARNTGEVAWKRVGLSKALDKDARRRNGYVDPKWRGPSLFSSFWSSWSLDRYKAAEAQAFLDSLKISNL